MVTKLELDRIKQNLYVETTPKYTYTQLQLLLKRYAEKIPESVTEAKVAQFMVDLLIRKIAVYSSTPWLADEILEQSVLHYK